MLIGNLHKVIILFVSVLFFSIAQTTYASDLLISPTSKSVNTSNTFTVSIMVSGTDDVNAYSGTVSFPTDKLEVVSLGKLSSVVDFWAIEPTFSNTTGKINFEGVTIQGYKGGWGNILNMTFRAKAVGGADIKLTEGFVLANDGFGSNVLSKLGSSYITISKPVIVEPEQKPKVVEPEPKLEPEPEPQPELEPEPQPEQKITSSTPEKMSWYKSLGIQIEWRLILIAVSIVVLLILIYLVYKYVIKRFILLSKKKKEDPDKIICEELRLLRNNLEIHLAMFNRIQKEFGLTEKEKDRLKRLIDDLNKTRNDIGESLEDFRSKEIIRGATRDELEELIERLIDKKIKEGRQ